MSGITLSGLREAATPLLRIRSNCPIWAVGLTDPQVDGRIGAQFVENAVDYDERYFHADAFGHSFRSVARNWSSPPPVKSILDLACGSGNSTVALCDEFPEASIIATDLSLELLLILDRRLHEAGHRDRVHLVWADTSSLLFERGYFDLVVGSSMLHHMEDPRAVGLRMIEAAAHGGVTMLFEPFLSGHLVLLQAIHGLLSLNEVNGGIEPEVMQALSGYALTIEVIGNPSTDPSLRARLDDKWLFSRRFFGNLAEDARASHWIVRTNPDGERIADKLTGIVYSATGGRASLPAWALGYLDKIDILRLGHLEDETLFEGGIGFLRK